MTTFDDREQSFERKYAHDQEMQFKVMARRNKLLGVWAAQQLGKSEAEVDAYAKSVVIADFSEPGDDDVLRKVLADLQAGGVEMDAQALRVKMDALLQDAMLQMQNEG